MAANPLTVTATHPLDPIGLDICQPIDAYLEACGVNNSDQRHALTAMVTEKLDPPIHHHEHTDINTWAVGAVCRMLDEWLAAELGLDPVTDEAYLAGIRANLIGGGFPDWPAAMLAGGNAAREMARAAAAAPPPVPPLDPLTMEPQPLQPWHWSNLLGLSILQRSQPPDDQPVTAAAQRYCVRRYLLLALILTSTLIATSLLVGAFQSDHLSLLDFVLLSLYAVLFCWICTSFWIAVFGLFVLTRREPGIAKPPPVTTQSFRTALVVPIYNEEPMRVFSGIRAMYRELMDIGALEQFEFFILSDTRDPHVWVQEQRAWLTLGQEPGVSGRVFYRNRPMNYSRKAGNITDFCQHWGARYRYMVVLDADSTMSGSTLVELVRRMEAAPETALLQVPPLPVGRQSLFARIHQFASSVYGPLFTAGLSFWQGTEGNFWGHNAIIRVAPFAAHCGLPILPGREPLGGEILSHDFVEAALLRRHGWHVRMAWDLSGSYEELPPTLIDYAKRDRRWCQGNLQHTRLVFARHLHPVSRIHFAMGVMSYLSSPLWFLFLICTGFAAYVQSRTEHIYFFGEDFRVYWPVSYTVEMGTVLLVTLAIFLLPKIFALLLLAGDRKRRRGYGGLGRATASALLETLYSALAAPIFMLFQSRFVWAILFRRTIGWPTQQRADYSTSLREALFSHSSHTIIGLAAGILTYRLVPQYFWWSAPVLLGLVLSILLSMLSSRVDVGLAARRLGLFLIPEEHCPPQVLRQVEEEIQRYASDHSGACSTPATIQMLRSPALTALHLSLLTANINANINANTGNRRQRHHLDGLLLKFEDEGPTRMTTDEVRQLLLDRHSVQKLHAKLYSAPAPQPYQEDFMA